MGIPSRSFLAAAVLLAGTAWASNARADFSQGFEADNTAWTIFGGAYDATRVASGTGGITSASGAYHATVSSGATNWGGYNSVFPTGGYTTSVDIFLDVGAPLTNDTRFDWTSAINNAAGTHRRDFAFNGGFYNDESLGNRFVITASTNTGRSNSYPKNPGRSPITINTTGWYTFQHEFYDAGGGVLAVDLSVLDSADNVLGTWTLSDPTDIIGSTIGGNRYGWMASNEFTSLAIDNASLTTAAVPEPASLTLLTVGAALLIRRKR